MVHPLVKKLPCMEVFGPTIQGEGCVIGQQTYFIRFGLCDYKCTMCDSMHAVDPTSVSTNAEWLTQPEILDKFVRHVLHNGTRWVTLSGGNPAIHDLNWLTIQLKRLRYKIAVETQGTFAPDWLRSCDVVTCSPKGPGMGERFDQPLFEAFLRAKFNTNIKVVVFGEADIEFAETIAKILQLHNIPLSLLYLSQGNPYPPGAPTQPQPTRPLSDYLRDAYLATFNQLLDHPTLSACKFLPQWHTWLWGNKQGV